MLDSKCVWCGKNGWSGIHRPDPVDTRLCDACALDAVSLFLRGRHEFVLAKQIEAFFTKPDVVAEAHGLPSELELLTRKNS